MESKTGGHSVFISYARGDEKRAREVRELIRSLDSAGLDTWLDETEIRAGEDWEKQIEDELRRAQVMVILLTPESSKSPWTLFELGAAIADAKKIIPVLWKDVEPEDVPPILKNLQWIKGSTPSETGRLIAEAVERTQDEESG